jgi:hypothetical protein
VWLACTDIDAQASLGTPACPTTINKEPEMETIANITFVLAAALVVVAAAFSILFAAKIVWRHPALTALLVATTITIGMGFWFSITEPPAAPPGSEFADPRAAGGHDAYGIACWPSRRGGISCRA